MRDNHLEKSYPGQGRKTLHEVVGFQWKLSGKGGRDQPDQEVGVSNVKGKDKVQRDNYI